MRIIFGCIWDVTFRKDIDAVFNRESFPMIFSSVMLHLIKLPTNRLHCEQGEHVTERKFSLVNYTNMFTQLPATKLFFMLFIIPYFNNIKGFYSVVITKELNLKYFYSRFFHENWCSTYFKNINMFVLINFKKSKYIYLVLKKNVQE